ncbi:MAG: iron-sulfur cluster insertion protein ErpA [Methylacidiphilales bacterium]|nr:iron-sulfur cluster insertion protein ErpA [Candidatus Methylacidiphilales bacterium]
MQTESYNLDKAEIDFSDVAARRVGELLLHEDDPNLKLRIFITGGGCSGFQYGFTFTPTIEDGDLIVENQLDPPAVEGDKSVAKVSLLIDPMSYQYLIGASIDYRDDLQGAQFVINNPNATTTCGCGSSFKTE